MSYAAAVARSERLTRLWHARRYAPRGWAMRCHYGPPVLLTTFRCQACGLERPERFLWRPQRPFKVMDRPLYDPDLIRVGLRICREHTIETVRSPSTPQSWSRRRR